jgi:hypothetical protein
MVVVKRSALVELSAVPTHLFLYKSIIRQGLDLDPEQ